MSNCYTCPSVDVSYHVSVHLAKQFQRRRICLIDKPEKKLPMVVMFVNVSGHNEHFNRRLPSMGYSKIMFIMPSCFRGEDS